MKIYLDELSTIAEHAFRDIRPDDLAFLFASGKSEGFLRDQLGIALNKRIALSGQDNVTREWKKHDLALMNGNNPVLLIEGKSWICHDSYRKSKLLTDKKSIYQGALNDVKKLLETRKRYPNVSIYISTVIYGVNTAMRRTYRQFNITYGDSHNKGITSAGNFSDLVGISRSHATILHSALGPTRRFALKVGSFHGMDIEADFFLTQIIEQPSKNLMREVKSTIFE